MGMSSMGGGSVGMGAPAPASSNRGGPVHMGDVGVDGFQHKGKKVNVGQKDDLDFSGDELDDDLLPGM